MRILMLHGSRQSGELFYVKLQEWERVILQDMSEAGVEVSFVYPTGPFEIEATTEGSHLQGGYDTCTWWEPEGIYALYPGLDDTLELIASILKSDGPFDGVIGFGQGAALAAMVASLLEPDRQFWFIFWRGRGGIEYPVSFKALEHPPLKFVISISGYTALHSSYRPFYFDIIRTPILHIIGTQDDVVGERERFKLPARCHGQMIFWHPGGHIIPSGKQEIDFIGQFIKATMS